jgi:hypothetical protein
MNLSLINGPGTCCVDGPYLPYARLVLLPSSILKVMDSRIFAGFISLRSSLGKAAGEICH